MPHPMSKANTVVANCRPQLPELKKLLKGLGADVVTTEAELRGVLSMSYLQASITNETTKSQLSLVTSWLTIHPVKFSWVSLANALQRLLDYQNQHLHSMLWEAAPQLRLQVFSGKKAGPSSQLTTLCNEIVA